jgi:hypothetical protein
MNKYLLGALALTATSTPGIANENEWLSMDSELESLRSFTSQSDGPNLSGWVISSLRFSSDVTVAPSGNDLGGFNLDSVRLNVSGSVNDYSYMVSTELGGADGAAGGSGIDSLLDAYIDCGVGESLNLRVGNFRTPFLASAAVSRNHTLFTDRSALGAGHAGRSSGLQLSGDFNAVRWALAAQNGSDGLGDEFQTTLHAEFDALGGGGAGDVEGAYGAGDDTQLTVGLSLSDDGAVDDGSALALDAQFTQGPFGASFEYVDYDAGAGIDWYGTGVNTGDSSPWGLTGSYMFGEDGYEVGVRYEDSDDDASDATALTVGVNRYIRGHDAKWGASLTQVDATGGDSEVFTLSVALGF